jgi:plastocyanin
MSTNHETLDDNHKYVTNHWKGAESMFTAGKLIQVRLSIGMTLLSAVLMTFLTAPLASAHEASQPRTWQAVVGVESENHAIQGMAFLPRELWIDVGDTVVWTVKSGDIHTLTFLSPGQTLPSFNQADPFQVLPQGSQVYDGVSYYNSGLMSAFPGLAVPGGRHYRLTFGTTGDFTAHNLVHPSMVASIHVRPAGTHYPFSQHDYERQIDQETTAILRDGRKLADQAEDRLNNHHVTLGIGDGLASVMRYFPQRIVLHVGQTIIFTNRDVMEPHTVTEGPTPSSGDFAPYGDPRAFDGQPPLNSGFIGTNPAWFGTTFGVTFVKAGTYAFRCDLHDYLGMVATIVVLPRS